MLIHAQTRALVFAAVLAMPITVWSQQIFVSNSELDKHVIYQDFDFYVPYDSTIYSKLAQQAPALHSLGITDVWFAPPYRPLRSFFEEGYAVADRYDLGEFPAGHEGATATKYGTAAGLRTAITSLHNQGMNAIADLVPNQLFLDLREVTSVTATDIFGNPNNPNVVSLLYPGYTKGGGSGQATYGFIKQWNHTYENGFSTQNLGLYRIMVDGGGTPYRYFGPGDIRNNLPPWLVNSAAAAAGALNTIDSYLSADGYFAVAGIGSLFPTYRPYLLYYTDSRPGVTIQNYLDYVRLATGTAGSTDDQVRQYLITAPNSLVSALTDQYLLQQPGYYKPSEAGIAALRIDKPDESDVNKNVLQYEFLIGTDIDNSNSDVQAEALNWQRFLLDQYNFDGFRFDAAGHVNTDILRQSADLMYSRFAGNMNNHLSVLESYVDGQVDFENSNRNGQLTYDGNLFSALLYSLEASGAGSGSGPIRPLSDVVTQSIAAAGRRGNGTAIPNWSFVSNHDQEHNIIATIPVSSPKDGGAMPDTALYQSQQMAAYDVDRRQVMKQYAPYNVPAAYALILTNKDTVPTVFYGDLYEGDQPYATVKTPYYDMITQLLDVRQSFVAGDQQATFYTSNTSSVAGQDLIANIRFGTSRANGVAVVIGNNPSTNTTIQVDMGSAHVNQIFTNAVGGVPETAVTDGNGVLTVHVVGTATTPQVHGYLGVWVPAS